MRSKPFRQLGGLFCFPVAAFALLPWGQYEAEWREVDDIRQKIAELAAKPSRMN
jgi:hypothetical protein